MYVPDTTTWNQVNLCIGHPLDPKTNSSKMIKKVNY